MAATQREAKNITAAPCTSRRHLPADLIREILSRLPVKSLLRFRCVSKPWLSLVDDDADLARSHLNTFKNNRDETRLFVLQYTPEEYVVRCSDSFEPIWVTPFTPSTDYLYVVSSLHGLILIKYRTNKVGHFQDLKVWNPSIRKLQEIPPLLKPQVSDSSFSVHDKDIGFGYDPVANNYKHVKLIFVNRALHSVAIYDLVACTWKIINCSNWRWDAYGFNKAVYFRSSLYFIARDDKGWDLVWFDLSKEVFSSVSMPSHPYFSSSHYNWQTLATVDGGSSLVALGRVLSDIDMWALHKESMCWTKRHLSVLKGCSILHVKKNCDMLTSRIFKDVLADETGKEKSVLWEEVGSYSYETEEHKTLLRQHDSVTFHLSCFVESLILHKMN